MPQLTWSYTGRGPIWLRNRAIVNGPRVQLGNASQLELAAEEESAQLPDYTQMGGGLANEITRIASMAANITAFELSPQNIAIGLRGLVSEVAAGSVANEVHVAYPGSLVKLQHVPDLAQTLTAVVTGPAWAASTVFAANALVVASGHVYRVTAGGGGESGSSAPVWPTTGGTVTDGDLTWTDLGTTDLVAGTDYERSTAGLVPTEGGKLSSLSGASISVTYTRHLAFVIEALTSAGGEWELVFEGLNEAESGRPVVVTLHRIKFSPTSAMGLISEDLSFASLPMVASVLSAPEITAQGLSKFVKVQMAA